jgi:hypothetical protein
MINVVIWSKDRACQLDLTLQTYKKHFKEWKEQSVTIIYKWSTITYKLGYDKVMELHPEFKFICEKDFRLDTLTATFDTDKEYISFMVDDDIFINDMTLDSNEFKEFVTNPKISCLSPRISYNVNYCYTQNNRATPPITMNDKNMWNWKDGCSGDWNYPWSVAAFHIFRKSDLYSLSGMNFKAPNTFEAALCNIPFTNRDYMICFNNAKTFTGANNRVQQENSNRHENTDPINVLNTTFISGRRLSSEVNVGHISNACHGPVKYVWC